MSNNRFILGAGIGYKPDEFEHVGWGFKNRASRFEECLDNPASGDEGSRNSLITGSISGSTTCTSCRRRSRLRTTALDRRGQRAGMLRAGRIGDGWLISFAEHLLELQDKVATLQSDCHRAWPSRDALPDARPAYRADQAQIDPDWFPNVIKVWQAYADLGSKADRDALSNEVMFGGKR